MNVENFRNNSRIAYNPEFVNSILSSFVNSKSKSYDARYSFTSEIEKEYAIKGQLNKTQRFNLLNDFMFRDLIRNYGEEYYKKLNYKDKKELCLKEYRKLEHAMEKKINLTFSSTGYVDFSETKGLNHILILNINPNDYIRILHEVCNALKDRNLDDVRVNTLSFNGVVSGKSNVIRVKCNSKDLKDVLELLNELDLSMCGRDYHPIYMRTGQKYGYDVIDSKTRRCKSQLICSILYKVMNDLLEDYLKTDATINGEPVKEFYDKQENKYLALKAIVKNSLELNDKLISAIYERFSIELYKNGFDLTDIFGDKGIDSELDNIYGARKTISELFEERLEENRLLQEERKASVIKVPFKAEIPKEIQELSEEPVLKTEDDMDKALEELGYSSIKVEYKIPQILPSEEEAYLDGLLEAAKETTPTLKVEEDFDQELADAGYIHVDIKYQDVSEEDIYEEFDKKEKKHLDKLLEEAQEPGEPLTDKETDQLLRYMEEDGVYTRSIFSEKDGLADISYLRRIAPLYDAELHKIADRRRYLEELSKKAEASPTMNVKEGVDFEFKLSPEVEALDSKIRDMEKAIEEASKLTEEEKVSLMREQLFKRNPLIEQYEDYVDDISILDLKLAGSDKTIAEYFEENNIRDLMEPNDIIEMHDGIKVRVKSFIVNNLVDYLTRNGRGDLPYVLSLYGTLDRKVLKRGDK